MTVIWTSREIAAVTGGEVIGDWQASGLSIDSRTVQPGDLFIALKGPQFDGHDYIEAALAKGAVAAMATHVPGESPAVIVDDPLKGLEKLATLARTRFRGKVCGVTGSVGKTGAKEALRHLLSTIGETYASVASYNNHWGVPYSLAQLPISARFAVFEMGMNHAGEIAPLSRLVRPDTALITNVEAAHIGNLGSLEAIADAKAEIFTGLTQDGIAILNRDSSQFARLARQAPGLIWSFGVEGNGEATLSEAKLDADGSMVKAEILGRSYSYRIPMPGRHLVLNSLGILLTVAAMGGDLGEIVEAYATMPPLGSRGTRLEVPVADGTATLIDETHNASPVATSAAIAVLGMMQPRGKGRRLAILGDMLELGDQAPTYHRDLAPELIKAGVDKVFLCGPLMRHLYDALPTELRGAHAADSATLLPMVQAVLRPHDIALVKGSRGSKMKIITAALQEEAANAL
jgi:UDP-N-acetylmuramoyl-tripeptide--D-alanyl-D-alanine ligase